MIESAEPASLWDRVVAPSPALDDVADRLRARLLASLLATILLAGLVSGLIQLALVPGFLPTFLVMLGALGVLAVAYAASRTRRYRVGGALAALAVIGACIAIPAWNPDDHVWYAFMSIGVLLASAFLSPRAAAAFAALAVVAVLGVAAAVPALREPHKLVPALMFLLVFSPLVLIAARQRDRIEEERRRALLEAHARVAESQRLETLGRLAGGIAHDFGNVLTVVSGSVDGLRARAPGPEVEDVAAACTRSSALVRQLLAFARRQPLAPRVVALDQVVAEMEGILRRLVGDGVHLVLDVEAGPVVRADPAQLEQVLLNLVVNAREATLPGGTIRVHAGGAGGRVPDTRAAGWGRWCVLEVQDTGHGMSAEVRARLFEPFFTTKTNGTGFGLATVYGIVAQSGGHVAVRSAPGAGATFTVFLPVVEAGADPAAADRGAAAG